MKRILPILLLSVTLGGCASFFGTKPVELTPVQRLQANIDRVLADSIFLPTQAAVKVVSAATGEVLYDRNSKLLMHPASNNKLLTSAAAIGVLGTDYKFITTAETDGAIVGNLLSGNLYLKGSGNPDLETDDLDTLAARLKALGVSRISGSVIADGNLFDSVYMGSGWMWNDEPADYMPYLTGIALNKNCIRVFAAPDTTVGSPLLISTLPATRYMTIVNRGTTSPDTPRTRVSITRPIMEHNNTVIIEGSLNRNGMPYAELLSVWNPTLYAATVFTERLQAAGIEVEGSPAAGTTPANARRLTAHEGSIDSIVINLNKVSDNLSAENFLKTLGAVKRGLPGSAENGAHVVCDFLSAFGIDTNAYQQADGSGLSFYDLVSPEILCKLLIGMERRGDLFPLFYASLPVAGVDGTLRSRMRRTSAEGNLRAKTGSISGVSSLSGYVTTADGERLVFSMMMQNFITPTRLYRNAQDSIGVLLASFSRRAPLASADKGAAQ